MTHISDADDGERVELTDKVYGACLVTIFHTLQKQDRLTLESFPDLESFLRSASNWGKNMSGVGSQTLGYWKVCKTIARQLYSNKWAETKALHEKMRDEWIESLDEQDKKDAREELAPNSDDDSDDGTNPWFKQREGETDGSEDRRNFVVSRIWKEYKLFLRGGQPGPVRKCLVPAGWTSHDASLALARGRDMYGGDSD